MDGESFFLVMPYCNTECMQVFLNQLRSTFMDDVIVLICDGAAWHKSGTLEVPEGMSKVTSTVIDVQASILVLGGIQDFL